LIWMALVAAGLCVTWLQIQKDHSNSWMMVRVGLLTCLTLYVCAFVSFDRAIARYNLTHHAQLDKWYVCSLGEGALPEIQNQTGQSADQYCDDYSYLGGAEAFIPNDWREWGFRNWRVRRSLKSMTEAVMIP
jgi:hypothetical protein